MEGKVKRFRIKGNTYQVLSPGERLIIWRRRKKWTQLMAAEHFGVSIFAYKLAEYDKKPEFPYKKLNITLAPHERCVIYRKRANKTQEEISQLYGVSRYWVHAQELGIVPCEKLLAWWENK